MPYSVTIEADSIRELTGKVTDLAFQLNGQYDTGPAPAGEQKPAPKKTETKKVEPKAAEPEAQPEAETETKVVEEKPAADPAPSSEDFAEMVRPVVLKLVEVKGRPAMEEVLAQFGIQRATQVAEGQRSELLAALEDALKA